MKKPGRKPYADTTLVKFLKKRILEMRPEVSQIEIAATAGFAAVNTLAMIKNGSARLPLDRVLGLADALDTDPRYVCLLALEQQGKAVSLAIQKACGHVVTENEFDWITELREASAWSNPALTTKGVNAIWGLFSK